LAGPAQIGLCKLLLCNELQQPIKDKNMHEEFQQIATDVPGSEGPIFDRQGRFLVVSPDGQISDGVRAYVMASRSAGATTARLTNTRISISPRRPAPTLKSTSARSTAD